MDDKKNEKGKMLLLYGWILIFCIALFATSRHLIQLQQWMALLGLGVETAAIAIMVLLLWRYRSPERDSMVRQVAIFGMYCVVLAGFLSLIAFRWIQ